jgi:predicted amidophosphoribosyltransferase
MSQASRTVTYKVKNDGFIGSTRVIAHAARRVAEHLGAYLFLQACFGLDVTLVPIPRSSPRRAGFLWPAERICACLLAEGLGRDILRCLARTQPVQQASSAAAGQRPNPPDHYASITVRAPQSRAYPSRITLVDDVITRGSSFVGIVPRIQEVYPDATVQCFALVRTISSGDVDVIFAPTAGIITYRNGLLMRQP